MERQFLTTKEVAELLRISRDTVRRMFARGDLRGFCTRKTMRISVDSIRAIAPDSAVDVNKLGEVS